MHRLDQIRPIRLYDSIENTSNRDACLTNTYQAYILKFIMLKIPMISINCVY